MPQKTIHQINNLLADISFSAELLARQAPGKFTTQEKKSLQGIVKSVKKIAGLIDKIKH